MFHDNQIVFDVFSQQPVKAYSPGAWRATHFIHENGKRGYELFLPKSVEEAKQLLAEGRIAPAPLPYSHCTKCFNWMSNHNKDGSCFKHGELK